VIPLEGGRNLAETHHSSFSPAQLADLIKDLSGAFLSS
jgi:hypothetical protein